VADRFNITSQQVGDNGVEPGCLAAVITAFSNSNAVDMVSVLRGGKEITAQSREVLCQL
jgi:hypothetical protein